MIFQLMTSGFLVGGVYALIALGVVFIYQSTRVFNFAIGELLLIGSFICWTFLALFDWSVPFSILLALAMSILVGLVVYRLVMSPLIGQPIMSGMMATLGLSILLRGIVSFIWTPSTFSFPAGVLPGNPLLLGDVVISNQLLWSFCIAVLVFAIFTVIFQRTSIGLGMRATAEDHQLAQATGINVKSIFAITWAVAAVVATIGGILLGVRLGLGVGTTPLVALKVFPVVLFGGLDSVAGAMIGGIVVGVIETLAAGLIDPKIAEITPYILLLLVLIVRPEGIFGLKRIERV